MSKIISQLIAMLAIQQAATAATITLPEALQRARENSPALRAARLQTQAAEKSVAASGLWSSPELEFEAEGLGEEEMHEYSVSLKQTFQRGGKQQKERAIALQTVAINQQTRLQQERDLDTLVQQVFIELMTQQEIDQVRSQQAELGRAFIEVAKKRLQAGGGSELDVVQAELAFEQIKLAQTCCFGDLKAEQEKLATLLNVPVSELPKPVGSFYELESLDTATVGAELPRLKQLDALAEQARARAQFAAAKDAPDVTVRAGAKYEPEEDVNTFMVSAAIPLNFTRRGRKEQAAALLQADALLAQRAATERQLQRERNSLLALYSGAKAQVDISNNRLIPKAQEAYELSRKGYEAGRFSWLELIAAQQNLAEIRINHIEYLREAHLIRADLSQFMNEER